MEFREESKPISITKTVRLIIFRAMTLFMVNWHEL
jgi:hypothetical protein